MRFTGLFVVCYIFALSVPAQSTTGWTLAWADEFAQADGSSPDTNKWSYDLGAGGWGNGELETYTTTNARIQSGQLVIEANRVILGGTTNYYSARMLTKGKSSWTHGRVEARIKIPYGQGIWPAFWMLGANIGPVPWPNCGEIDIMENIGREPNIVHGTIHGPGYSGGGGIGGPYSLQTNAPFADDFHVYAVEWTTNQMKWFVDGVQYFSVTSSRLPPGTTWVFTQPQFILLNLAVGGQWPGNPDGTTVFPQRMIVDYVRVYAPSKLTACGNNLLSNPGMETGGFANWAPYGAGFNTLSENINNVPVHDGSNVFKVFGQFSGGANDSGMFQDIAAIPGQVFRADGWVMTPGGDVIAGANTAWIEISFRDASTNIFSLYRTSLINSNTATGGWLKLAVTNQLNPVTAALIGFANDLVAPAGTTRVRYQAAFRQPATAAGAVLFDDLSLQSGPAAEITVPVSAALVSNSLRLDFATYLDLPYQIRWKGALTDPDWQPLTNISGEGVVKSVMADLQTTARFYTVMRLCN